MKKRLMLGVLMAFLAVSPVARADDAVSAKWPDDRTAKVIDRYVEILMSFAAIPEKREADVRATVKIEAAVNATTAASCGAVDASHDSLTPMAGGMAKLNIALGEIVFGGVGSGLYGMLIFAIIDLYRMWRGYKKLLALRHPGRSTRGLLMLGINRALSIRPWRAPAPRVKRGAKL